MKSSKVNLRINIPLKAILTTILILTFAVPVASLPAANAHTPEWQIPTFAYVVALPNPIGVHQTTIVYLFLGNPPYPDSAIANDYRYHNYQLSITNPEGKVEKKSWPTIMDTTNSQMYLFTPTETGTYTFEFTYPGQKVNDYSHLSNSAYLNDEFLASSYTTTVTVQADPVPTVADPLPPAFPTEYWTRPIYGENTAWWNISSNWLGSGILGYGGMCGPNEQMFPGDAVGPLTSHIMWAKPLQSGGVVGGDNYEIQGNQYFEGSAYNQRFLNPIIVNQRLYYTEPLWFYSEGSLSATAYGPEDCVDLRTGKLIWSRADVPPLSFALIWDNEDPQQHGVTPALLFTSNFARAFDADTGNQLFNVTGVPSGSSVLGPRGEVLKYVIANAGNTTSPDWRLGQWNSTRLWSGMGFPGNLTTTLIPVIQNSSNGNSLTIRGGIATDNYVVDASISKGNYNRFDWNISIPWRNSMPASGGNAPSIIGVFPGNLLLCRNGSYPALGPGAYLPYTYFAINLKSNRPGNNIGDVLWWSTIDPPAGKNITTVTYAGASIEAGVFVESYRQTSQFVGYSLADGKYLWGPTASQCPLDYYGSQGPGTLADQIAYGRIYSVAYSGILHCYDMKTGETLWTYGNGGAGNSTNGNLIVPGPYPRS